MTLPNGTHSEGVDVTWQEDSPATADDDTCFRCGEQGHWSKDCPQEAAQQRGWRHGRAQQGGLKGGGCMWGRR